MANVIFTGAPPPGLLPNKQFEEGFDEASIRQAFGSGGTQKEQLQQLISQNPRAFLSNAPALKTFFDLQKTPVQPDFAAILGNAQAQVPSAPVTTPGLRTGVDAFSASPAGEAAFQQQQNVQQVFDQFGQGTFRDDPGLQAELDIDTARGGEALMREAEELEQTVQETSTSTLGKEFDDAKRPLPRKAVATIKNFDRRRTAILKRAADNPNNRAIQQQTAVTLKKMEEILGPGVKAARAEIAKTEAFNDALTKSKAKFVADARLKSNEEQDFKFSKDFQDGLLERGIPSMEAFLELKPPARKKIMADIRQGSLPAGSVVNASDITNVSVIGPDGKPETSFLASFTEETDPETLLTSIKMHRLDPEGFEGKTLVKSSVISPSPGDVSGAVKGRTIEKGQMIDSALLSISGMETDFLTLKDADLNSLLNVSGGLIALIDTVGAAVSGLENTFSTQSAFTDQIFRTPVLRRIVDELAPEQAAFLSSYSWTLFKLAIATQEGAGRALSDKDIERVKPQIRLRSAKALKSSLAQAAKNLRRQRRLVDRQLNIANPALSVKDIDGATSVEIDTEGNVRSLGKTKLSKPKTKIQKFRELF